MFSQAIQVSVHVAKSKLTVAAKVSLQSTMNFSSTPTAKKEHSLYTHLACILLFEIEMDQRLYVNLNSVHGALIFSWAWITSVNHNASLCALLVRSAITSKKTAKIKCYIYI